MLELDNEEKTWGEKLLVKTCPWTTYHLQPVPCRCSLTNPRNPENQDRRIYMGNIAIFKIAIFWSYHLHLREKSRSFSFTKLRDFLVGSAHVRSLLFPLPDGRWSEARATVQRKNLVSSWLQCVLLLSSIAIDNSTSIAKINKIKAFKNDKIWARWVRRLQLAAQIESQQARATVESVV